MENLLIPIDHQIELTGESMTIRSIRLSEADMEAEFIQRLSPESSHFKFLGGLQELPEPLIKKFCGVDRLHSMAFVATVEQGGQEIEVGVSRFASNSKNDVREMAVTVADEWQRKGLGTILANRLIEFAKGHGIRQLYSVDLAGNMAMRQLAKDIGMQSKNDPDDVHRVIYSLAV